VASEIFSALAQLTKAHATASRVGESACAALMHLAAGSDKMGAARKQAAVDAGSLGALVAVLRAHGHSTAQQAGEEEGVQAHPHRAALHAAHAHRAALNACWALSNLCLGTDAAGLARKQAAFEAGAVPVLLRVAEAHCAHADTAEQALKSLGTLLAGSGAEDAAAGGRQAAALEGGALGVTLGAMRQHTAHEGVARFGCMVMRRRRRRSI